MSVTQDQKVTVRQSQHLSPLSISMRVDILRRSRYKHLGQRSLLSCKKWWRCVRLHSFVFDFVRVFISQRALTVFIGKNNRHFPRRIIYYRDGVSESEFERVYEVEGTAIARAFLFYIFDGIH